MILAAIGGLLFGSFASATAYRLPRGESFVTGRSRCPHCKAELAVRHLVPVFSYLVNRGRCAACTAPISARYPLAEAITALLFVISAAVGGPTFTGFALAALAVGLVIVTLVDLEFQIIPDVVLVTLFVLGTVYRLMSGGTAAGIDAGLGAAAGIAIAWSLRLLFRQLKQREALGLGDVKFFGVAGVWIGVAGLADFMLLSGVIGIVFAVGWRGMGRGEIFPFGPALAAALFAGVVAGELDWPPLVVKGADLLMLR